MSGFPSSVYTPGTKSFPPDFKHKSPQFTNTKGHEKHRREAKVKISTAEGGRKEGQEGEINKKYIITK